MLTKRLCILLILFLTVSVVAARLTAEVNSPDPAGEVAPATTTRQASVACEVTVVDKAAVQSENAATDTPAAQDEPADLNESTTVNEPVAVDEPTIVSHIGWELEEIASVLEKVLPESWQIASIRRRQVPRKWTGSPDAILVKLEDCSMVVHHHRGFQYHPFYKIWLCPPRWKGNMEQVEFLGDDGPSVLLGQNHRMKVFYLTLGANTWPEGAEKLREVLDLTALPITNALRQRIDPSMRMKLLPSFTAFSNGNGTPGLLSRIVGMEKEGPLAYLEYATATERKCDGHMLPSRCREPRVVRLMERENLFLANRIFVAYPEVETVYLRRVCDDFLSDRIINRSHETSESPVVVSNSSH